MSRVLLRVLVAVPLAALVAFPERHAAGVQYFARDGRVLATLEVVGRAAEFRSGGPTSIAAAIAAAVAKPPPPWRTVIGSGSPHGGLPATVVGTMEFEDPVSAGTRVAPCGRFEAARVMSRVAEEWSISRPCVLRYAGLDELLPRAWR